MNPAVGKSGPGSTGMTSRRPASGLAGGVVLANHVAHAARGFLVGTVGAVAALPHAEEHAPVHRLQTVAHVGQRAADDHAHRVIEVAALHLLFDVDRDGQLAAGIGGRAAAVGAASTTLGGRGGGGRGQRRGWRGRSLLVVAAHTSRFLTSTALAWVNSRPRSTS